MARGGVGDDKSIEETNGGGETNQIEEGVSEIQSRPPNKTAPIPQYSIKDIGTRETLAQARGRMERARQPVPAVPPIVSSAFPLDSRYVVNQTSLNPTPTNVKQENPIKRPKYW